MEGYCEYIEYTFEDRRLGVVLQLWDLSKVVTNLQRNNASCLKEPRTLTDILVRSNNGKGQDISYLEVRSLIGQVQLQLQPGN